MVVGFTTPCTINTFQPVARPILGHSYNFMCYSLSVTCRRFPTGTPFHPPIKLTVTIQLKFVESNVKQYYPDPLITNHLNYI